jgi:hypothetical protein
MSHTISKDDIIGMFRRYARAVIGTGILEPGERLEFTIGSKTNGIGYRVHLIKSNSTGHSAPPFGRDYLGQTKGEAYDALAMMAATLEDASYYYKRKSGTTETVDIIDLEDVVDAVTRTTAPTYR